MYNTCPQPTSNLLSQYIYYSMLLSTEKFNIITLLETEKELSKKRLHTSIY